MLDLGLLFEYILSLGPFWIWLLFCLIRFDTKEEAIDHLRQSHPGNEQQHCLRVEQPVSKPNEKPFTYKLFYCDFCWKEFTWRANLVRHINIHTHEKIFPCSTCKKTFRFVKSRNYNFLFKSWFSSHTSLRRHEQKHQGINYKCAKCSRNFNDPSNLRRHELSCNGEHQLSEDEIEPKKEEKEEVKPHRCGYCSKVSLKHFRIIANFFTSDHLVAQ